MSSLLAVDMRGDCLEEGLLPSKVKSTEFESGRLTGPPGFNEFGMDSLDCVLSGLSRKSKGLENDGTETLRAPMN